MYNPKRIAKLFMLYTLQELSSAEEAELYAWRQESPRNEEIFQYETNPENIAHTFKEIEENSAPILQKIKDAYPRPWAGKIRNLWPGISIPYWLKVAISLVVIFISGYFIFNKWNKSRVLPGSYQANIISFDGV